MSQAIDLMIVGMGFVFVFLLVLVLATGLMSRVILRFAPEPATPATPSRSRPQGPAQVDPDTAEAIRKAIAQYRARHKK